MLTWYLLSQSKYGTCNKVTSSSSTSPTSVSSTATTISAPTTSHTTITTWTSLGCYVDVTTSRTLANQIILPNQDTTMTVELCQQTCRSSGYIFAGLEYAHQCWCANSILNNGPATSGCTSPCPGNTAEMCGGSDRINVYSISDDTTSSTTSPTVTIISSTTYPSTSVTKSSSTTTLPVISSLPSCGQLCFNNLIGQYSSLGCSSPDPSCLCSNVNFGFGIRDCSNGACGTAVASTVIAYESAYCSSALATRRPVTTATPTATGVASLPSCGQTCFNNMLGQYSSLGCATADPACLCKNINFYYGLRDCSNAVCGSDTNAVLTILAFESSYCASATAAPTTS